jgi:hypothetical protein
MLKWQAETPLRFTSRGGVFVWPLLWSTDLARIAPQPRLSQAEQKPPNPSILSGGSSVKIRFA